MLWPYKIIVPYGNVRILPTSGITSWRDDFIKWMGENIKHDWHYLSWRNSKGPDRQAILGFKNEEDAMLTKLTWS